MPYRSTPSPETNAVQILTFKECFGVSLIMMYTYSSKHCPLEKLTIMCYYPTYYTHYRHKAFMYNYIVHTMAVHVYTSIVCDYTLTLLPCENIEGSQHKQLVPVACLSFKIKIF